MYVCICVCMYVCMYVCSDETGSVCVCYVFFSEKAMKHVVHIQAPRRSHANYVLCLYKCACVCVRARESVCVCVCEKDYMLCTKIA
jgi:hypothetical protein